MTAHCGVCEIVQRLRAESRAIRELRRAIRSEAGCS